MKVLWICNIMLPVIAEALHKEASNKEGWLSGLLEQVAAENSSDLEHTYPPLFRIHIY